VPIAVPSLGTAITRPARPDLHRLVRRPGSVEDVLEFTERRCSDGSSWSSCHDEPEGAIEYGQLFLYERPRQFFRKTEARNRRQGTGTI
jgi:hypothetical protein